MAFGGWRKLLPFNYLPYEINLSLLVRWLLYQLLLWWIYFKIETKMQFWTFQSKTCVSQQGRREKLKVKGEIPHARTCFCKLCQYPQFHHYWPSMKRTQWIKKNWEESLIAIHNLMYKLLENSNKILSHHTNFSFLKNNFIFINFFNNKIIWIEEQPINNVVIVSGELWRDSAIHIQISILPPRPLPSRLVHNIFSH